MLKEKSRNGQDGVTLYRVSPSPKRAPNISPTTMPNPPVKVRASVAANKMTTVVLIVSVHSL